MKKANKGFDFFYPIFTFLLIIFIWQFMVDFKDIASYIMPSPLNILKVFPNDKANLIAHSIVTIEEAISGLIMAIIVAMSLGIIMDIFPLIKKCFYPIMLVTQMIPTITIAPLMIIWFGFGMLPKVFLVMLTCFFPILISFVDGMENIDKDYLNLFKTMKASKKNTLIHLKIPLSMDEFFSGLKISGTYAIMAAVIAEWLGGTKGLGVYMVRAKSSYALDKVFASTILVVIFSLVFVAIIFLAKKLVIKKLYKS